MKNAEAGWPASHLENSEHSGRFLALKDLHGYVVHGNTGGGLAFRGAMMSMAVKYHVSAMTIDDFGQTRTAQVRIDFRRLSQDRVANRRIVKDHDTLGSSQVRHSAFQLQCFVDGSLNERLDFRFSESGQRAPSEAAGKALGAGKPHAVALVGRAIKKLDSGVRHHPRELALSPAFVVVISQDSHDW